MKFRLTNKPNRTLDVRMGLYIVWTNSPLGLRSDGYMVIASSVEWAKFGFIRVHSVEITNQSPSLLYWVQGDPVPVAISSKELFDKWLLYFRERGCLRHESSTGLIAEWTPDCWKLAHEI